MPASRKHHVKSRHGCQQCKARRTKCDEVRPICTKCARKGSACSFSEDTSGLIFVEGPNSRKFLQKQAAREQSPKAERMQGVSQARTTRSASSQNTPGTASSPSTESREQRGSTRAESEAAAPVQELQPLQWAENARATGDAVSVTHLEADNMRLMRHYTLYAWRACVSDPDGETEEEMCAVFRDIIPELAYVQPFLMHCMLATAALHYCLAGPCEPDRSTATFAMPARPSRAAVANLARHHHALALPLLREAIAGDIPDEVRPSLFAGSALVVVYSVASSLVASPDPSRGLHPDDDPVEALLQFIYLMEGISTIVKPVEDYIMNTPFRSYMLPTAKDPYAPLAPAAEGFFAGLRALVAAETAARRDERVSDARSASGDIAVPEAYVVAMGILRHTFTLQRECPGRQMISVPFPAIVPDLVVADIAARKPAALALAAGYATTMHWLRRHIWIQGWGRCVVLAIVRLLEQTGATDARAIVQWCVDQVETDYEQGIGAPTAVPVNNGEKIRDTAVRVEVESMRVNQIWPGRTGLDEYERR